MEITMWIIIVCLFVVSMIGLFIPIIPAVVAIWLGFLLYHFFIDSTELSIFFWIIMIGFTIILIGSDILTNRYFVHKFGGTRGSEWGGIIGVVIGAFVYPPFGIILVPFAFVFIIEIIQRRTIKEAFLTSIGTLAGFLSGIVAKFLIQSVMIIWFLVSVFFL